MKQETGAGQLLSIWKKVPVIIRTIISGFIVSTTGIAVWSILLLVFSPPVSIVLMIFALWAYWKFFSGHWGKEQNRINRSENFRKVTLSPYLWKWGLTGAVSFVMIVQAGFFITFRITAFPDAQFTSDYKILETMPGWSAWALLITSSVVAGICEETGYRGYLQLPLEKKYGPATAILISSVVFTLIHLGKRWAIPIIPQIFFASILLGLLAYKSGSLIPGIIGHSILDIFNYSVWWTHLTGGFHKETIFKTGMDLHFIFWILVIISGLFIFFRAINKLKDKKIMS